MQAVRLAGLEPAAVFGYFEKLCTMPHGSGNTKIISDYLVSFAKEQGIRYIQDELNNVILFGDATEGYEDHEPVIIQGHMDMVCEKDPDCSINFDTDGLDITHDGAYVFANGTPWAATTASPWPTPWPCWPTSPSPIRPWRSSSPWTRRRGCTARRASI